MLFKCYRCNLIGFSEHCPTCGVDARDENVPLDPSYYPEFKYISKGFVTDLFVKKKAKRELQDKMQSVLDKYSQFEQPYFVNYVHYNGRSDSDYDTKSEYSNLELFQNVLLRLGFGELREYPELTKKLVRSTMFRFDYRDFVNRTSVHIAQHLKDTLRSWIEERGSSFRVNLPMLLFYLWQYDTHSSEIRFNQMEIPLVEAEELDRLYNLCEQIYFDILVTRFKVTLERFDPSRFVTMYSIDAMTGYDFEDFLGKLLATIGYDVQITKRSGDQGADLFAEKFQKKIVIQAKNYSDSVGNVAVQQVLAAKNFYGCDEAMVMTNSYFTASAKELAAATGVKLVDRTGLQSYLEDYNQMIMQADSNRSDQSSVKLK